MKVCRYRAKPPTHEVYHMGVGAIGFANGHRRRAIGRGLTAAHFVKSGDQSSGPMRVVQSARPARRKSNGIGGDHPALRISARNGLRPGSFRKCAVIFAAFRSFATASVAATSCAPIPMHLNGLATITDKCLL